MAKAPVNTADPLLEFPGYLLRRASIAALARLNERLGELDLRHTDSSLLQLIRANPGIRPSDAGRALDIKRANMVPLVAKLEKRGLINRTPIDGRSQAIDLTDRGRVLAKKGWAVIEECERELMEKVPPEFRSAVLPILLALWKGDGANETDEGAAVAEPNNIKFLNNGTE